MSWFTRHFGLDGVDLAIHVALTGLGVAIVTELIHGRFGEILGLKVVAISLLILAWRRHRARKRMAQQGTLGLTSGEMAAERFQDLENRIAELEGGQLRMAELEERLDFAERLLAKSEEKPPAALMPGGRRG
jgi:hypothetical protein